MAMAVIMTMAAIVVMTVIVVMAVRMVVAVRMIVAVVMGVVMGVAVMTERDRDAIGLASARAFVLAEGAALDQAFNVMVVAALRCADFRLKTQHLGAVLAQ